MNGATNGQREKVAFPINEPVLLRLDYDDGELAPGKFGDQYKYTFDDSTRIAWLDPQVRTLIQKTQARAGDEIAITKREARDGNRKRVLWEVEKVEEEAAPHQEMGPAPAEERAAERGASSRAAQQPAPRKQAAAPRQSPHTEAISTDARTFADCIAAAVQAADVSGLDWDKNDIRAIATTIYINRGGGK